MDADPDRGQCPLEARARAVPAPECLVDARGQQQAGRHLAHALGEPDLAPADLRPPVPWAAHTLTHVLLPTNSLGGDGVREAILPLQVMHHPGAALPVVAVAHHSAVEADPPGDDVHVVRGVCHHDVGRVAKAHAVEVVLRERGPRAVAQVLALGQAQRAVMHDARERLVQTADLVELVRQFVGSGPAHVAAHDARCAVL